MQAVRLARYHTRRSHLVRFCGAYHGWWGDVQPGVGNPLAARETYTLQGHGRGVPARARKPRATSPACWSIRCRPCIPTRARPATRRSSTAGASAHFDRAAYAGWLGKLRAVCSARGIVLIFDEVFVGFRLRAGGAQEYFGVRADMVTYGKTVAGGLPVGVLCGERASSCGASARSGRPTSASPEARSTRTPMSWARCTSSCERLEGPDLRALVRRARRVLERERAAALNERLERGATSGAGRESLDDLDDLLHAAVCVQLDVSILSARGRHRPLLGGHRPPDLQPELHGRGVRRRSPSGCCRPPGRCSEDGWWWAEPDAPRTNPSGAGILKEMLQARSLFAAGSMSSPRSR